MTNRIKELISILNEASNNYYNHSETMSNFEYDKLYEELDLLEKQSGLVYSISPTQKVGYEVNNTLPKESHSQKALSLDKTKDVSSLKEWLSDKEGILSWKLDGLTVVLTYRQGVLVKAVTRGNGEVGELITDNAKNFMNIPLTISCKEEVILRGEAVIRYSDFEKINDTIEDNNDKYKNPRNLVSGSVRQLNPTITRNRTVYFYAFDLVNKADTLLTYEESLIWLKSLGFDCVEYQLVNTHTIENSILDFKTKMGTNDFPSDGLVLIFNNLVYGQSLGTTNKFPKNAIAFKWQDETATTVLREIEWSASRTGLINPVAIFDTVNLEGTDVSRASIHNLSIIEDLQLGIGDSISVYKANMIIPQIAENFTKSNIIEIPSVCPVCGEKTTIVSNHNSSTKTDIKTLMCNNKDCLAKSIKSFSHFVSRDALNIDGLSEATLEKFINKGFIKSFSDLYELSKYKEHIITMDGFGEKSYANLINAINASKETTLARYLYALGIPNVGKDTAKKIAKEMGYNFTCFRKALDNHYDFTNIADIGEVINDSINEWYELVLQQLSNGNRSYDELLSHLTFMIPLTNTTENEFIKDKTFVITGSLSHFTNREALKEKIEELGGKVSGSVSAKTHYLINNDKLSSSSKNKKAKELSIPIINEEDFLGLL